MSTTRESVRIAAVQAAPVFLDREATVEKARGLIAEASEHGARIVCFPEAFVPGYPDWVWTVPPGEGAVLDELYARMLDQAITVGDECTQRLAAAAREAGVYVVMGMNERRAEGSGGSLYNALLYLGPGGEVLGVHRKLVPTDAERMVWAPGDGSTLQVYDTPLGRLSGLICWENYMPLARYALYAQGVRIYVAATWDRGEPWLATQRHIAREGRVIVLGCCMALRVGDIPDAYGLKERYDATGSGWINEGNSAIVGPDGFVLAGPLRAEEGILYADVPAATLDGSRRMLDVAGHYARPDVFTLTVHTEARPALVTASEPVSS